MNFNFSALREVDIEWIDFSLLENVLEQNKAEFLLFKEADDYEEQKEKRRFE